MDLRQLWIKIQVKFSKFVVYNYFWIVFATIFIIAGLFGYLALFPKYQMYAQEKNRELPALHEQNKMLAQRINEIRSDQIDETQLADNKELQKLLRILPTEDRVADLFTEFEAMAVKENFKIFNFSVSETKDSSRRGTQQRLDQLQKMQIQISLAGGGYDSLKRLIALLESNLRLMDINSLSFIPNFNGSTLYSFMITTYYIQD